MHGCLCDPKPKVILQVIAYKKKEKEKSVKMMWVGYGDGRESRDVNGVRVRMCVW